MRGLMSLLLLLQDPFQNQIDDALRQFEAAAEIDQALTLLSSQLVALGSQATNPIARRLAQDLRDGMASSAAPTRSRPFRPPSATPPPPPRGGSNLPKRSFISTTP